MMFPMRRDKDLLVRQVGDETLVYDRKTHKAHCLNPQAATVWQHCDGQRSVTEIARLLDARLSMSEKTILVQALLGKLRKAKLLKTTGAIPNYSRRDLIRRLGISIAASVVTIAALPAVAHATHCQDLNETCSGGPGQGTCCTNCLCDVITNTCGGTCPPTH